MRKLIIFLCLGVLLCAPSSTLLAEDYECGLCGDINGDGAINILDITAFFQWYHHIPSVTPNCPDDADMDCDAAVFSDEYEILIDYLYNNGPAPCDTDEWPACL